MAVPEQAKIVTESSKETEEEEEEEDEEEEEEDEDERVVRRLMGGASSLADLALGEPAAECPTIAILQQRAIEGLLNLGHDPYILEELRIEEFHRVKEERKHKKKKKGTLFFIGPTHF